MGAVFEGGLLVETASAMPCGVLGCAWACRSAASSASQRLGQGYWLGYRCGDAPMGWGFLYQVLLIGEWYACFGRGRTGWHGLRPCSRARPLPQGSRHLLGFE